MPAVLDHLEQSSFKMIFPGKIPVSDVTPLGIFKPLPPPPPSSREGFDLGEKQDMARTLCDRAGVVMYTPEYPGCWVMTFLP